MSFTLQILHDIMPYPSLTMKYLTILLITLCTCLISSCAGTAGSSDSETQNRWLVVLETYQEFHAAKRDAESHAKASGIPFSMDGKIFDEKGLRLPENPADQMYAGDYLLRRFNTTNIRGQVITEYLSIEKSEAYSGFPSGKYIIVASVADTSEEAARLLKRLKPIAPKAFVKKTPIFLGCMF